MIFLKALAKLFFRKKIEDNTPRYPSQSQFDQLKRTLSAIEPGTMLNEIEDPVSWQKNIRHDW
jgi:hypothetical protein